MSFNLFKPLAVSVWLQASVWKMGNLVTFIDSNGNSHTLKFRNIFQVTMHIHTCFRQFLQQFGEIDRTVTLSMSKQTWDSGNFSPIAGQGQICVLPVLPVQGHQSRNRPFLIRGAPVLPNIVSSHHVLIWPCLPDHTWLIQGWTNGTT